jgi:hypothetical protein
LAEALAVNTSLTSLVLSDNYLGTKVLLPINSASA